METNTPEPWNRQIAELELFFQATHLTPGPIKLNQCATIADVPKFIDSHLETIKANNGKKTYLPYLERLQTLKQLLST